MTDEVNLRYNIIDLLISYYVNTRAPINTSNIIEDATALETYIVGNSPF